MFCGFPVMVATLPTLAPMATASRYGTGLRFRVEVTSSTSGVSTRHIVSLTNRAEKNPETKTIAASSRMGRWARSTTCALTARKNPDRRRFATTIIIPNSRMMVL